MSSGSPPSSTRERIVPVVVDIPAERSAPGRIQHRRDGTVTVPAGEAGEAFAALFAESVIAASTTDDFTTVAWTKLSLNCVGAVNALTGQPGGVVRKNGVADLMRAMVRECVLVGRAVGADLGDHIPDWVVERTETLAARFGELAPRRPSGRTTDGVGRPQRSHRAAGRRAWNRHAAERNGGDPAFNVE